MAVHITAKPSMQKAKGGQTLQASRVEASLQLKRGPEEGRKQAKDTLAAEVAEGALSTRSGRKLWPEY